MNKNTENRGKEGSQTATKEQLRTQFAEGNIEASKHSAGGAPENNQNPAKHHVYSAPSNLTEHLSDEDLAFINDLAEAYIEVAPFDKDDPRAERVLITCIKVWQEHSAEAQIAKEGLSEDVTVGIGQDGTPITEADSHHLRRAANQLNKEVRLTLKDLGLMNSAEKQQAEATKSLASILAGENDD